MTLRFAVFAKRSFSSFSSSRSCWYGKEKKKNPSDWIFRLTPTHIKELESQIDKFVNGKVNLATIQRDDVVLPTLGKELNRIQDEILNGQGFILIKGLPVHQYSIEQSAAAYWSIGTHFGSPTPQNSKGHLLGHVRDLGHDLKNPTTRIYATNAAQPFHVDLCDIVGLLCLKTSKTGGESIISSSITLYEEMKKLRPELVDLLSKPVYHDRKNEIPQGKLPYYAMPVFNFYKGDLSVFLSPDFVRTTERFPELPRHTPELKEAMQLLQDLSAREDIRLDMILEPGDMQFIHNHTIVHSRTHFEDFAEPEKKRHLLRLWLSPENARPLPEIFSEQYGNVIPGKRGGIRVPGVTPNVHYKPE